MTKRWVKVPGPGQFRGEAEWKEVGVEIQLTAEDWNYFVHYVPTAVQEERPEQ